MRLRLSIRYKMLMTIVAVLLLAMGTYLYLATSMFTKDKLAYIYDLNGVMVESLSEHTDLNLNLFVDKLSMFARDVHSATDSGESSEAIAAALFEKERDILRIDIYERDPASGKHVRVHGFVNRQVMEDIGLQPEDLDLIRKKQPIQTEALGAENQRLFLHNSSLPPDAALLTISCGCGSGESEMVVAADFLHQRLLRLFARSKLHQTFLVDESGIVLAHPDASKVIEHHSLAGHELVGTALGTATRRGVREFDSRDGARMLGAYAKVGNNRITVLTQIPMAEALRTNRLLIKRSVLFALVILIVAFIASVFFSRLLTAPIRRLSKATEVIGKGGFDVAIKVKSHDEIGDLARSFERMATELKETQTQLIRSEKLAAVGQLGAGITHEVKNPITGLVGFAQLIKENSSNQAKVEEFAKLIEDSALRCTDILTNFLKFTRKEPRKFERLDLNQVVADVAKIVNHHLMIHGVQLKVEAGENLPFVWGRASELHQAILNLAINAQQAMSGEGIVRMITSRDDGMANIAVCDNGPGIPQDIQDRIFEPFFTTKPAGEGTGLGLSIVFRIIRDHKGEILVDSQVGRVTTFTIRLPAYVPENQDKA